MDQRIQEIAKRTERYQCDCGCEAFGVCNCVKMVSRLAVGSDFDIVFVEQNQMYCLKCLKVFVPPMATIGGVQ